MILSMEHEVLSWVRVEVLSNLDDEDEIQVSLIDFGTREWVRCHPENSSFKKLPDEMIKIPCQSLPLHLPLGKVKSDEDEDMLLTLMTECILTSSESEHNFSIRLDYQFIGWKPNQALSSYDFSGFVPSPRQLSMDIC